MNRKFHVRVATAATLVLASLGASAMLVLNPVSGAIFTTEAACNGTDLNIYDAKGDVYLDGGPAHPGAAGLPDGSYYVQVTSPDGQLLGTSVGSGNDTPIQVVGGEFQGCYQLSSILIDNGGNAGYGDTPNDGGEYKVWVSTVSTFDNNSTKTDNFKIKSQAPPVDPSGTLTVEKWYDANANGLFDPGESLIAQSDTTPGWLVDILYPDLTKPTVITTWFGVNLTPGTYVANEQHPIETNWMQTGSYVMGTAPGDSSVVNGVATVNLKDGIAATVGFGNVCTGAGGGLTLGFWSNQNGEKIVTGTSTGNVLLSADQLLLRGLNLRNANGTFLYTGSSTVPTTQTITYSQFRTWILSASATNMANMLSAQLAAMELNVLNGKVSGTSLIYAPGATSANSLGFATVNAVMAEAVASLGANGYTVAAGSTRTYQEALKTALDKANNNLNFVQATACSFTFATP